VSRIADLLRGATITRIRFNSQGGWVEPDPSRFDEILRGAIAPAPRGLNYTAAVGPETLRASLLKAAGMVCPEHPSLSWQVNGTLLACRRADDTTTVCKRVGELTVVTDPGIPPCPKCYPTS
jgi:hypothetical protein